MAQEGLYEFIKKNGVYIELGAYVLAFISIFLPFINVTFFVSVSMSLFSVGSEVTGTATAAAIFLLLFVIASGALVGINTFANHIIENFKKNNESKVKTIDMVVDIAPFGFSVASFLIVIIAAIVAKNHEYSGLISLAVGFYFLLIAYIVAIAVRGYYLYFIKEIMGSKPNFETREVKTEQTNEVTVQVN